LNQNSVTALGVILLIVIIAAVIFGVFTLGIFPHGNTTTTQTGPSPTTCPSSGCIRKLPIRFIFNNLYTNQPIIASVTATIYKGTIQVDSGTTSSGVWDTTKADFLSGDAYSMYVASGNSKYEFNFQVPLAQNLTQTRFQITLNMALIGSYAVSVLGPDGVSIASGYNSTASTCNGVTPCKHPTFTVTITNNADNTGLTGTFTRTEVIENGKPRQLVANALVIAVIGSSGAPAKIHATTPIVTLPDHAVDKHRLQDGSLDGNAKGTYTTTLTFDTSGMTTG